MKISILLAVRNEEKNILRCLNALCKQDFPTQEMEVLIGNDQSNDLSRTLIVDFIRDKPHFSLIDIEGNLGTAKGKGNVIAHLAHHARGEYFLITDADVAVPPTWARGMLRGFLPSVGIVTGFTIVNNEGWLSMLDSIDWVLNIGLMNVASMLHLPTNSMGNNMAVRKLAYFETGGLEAQPFMITEDLAMFKAITKHGWDYQHLFSPDILGITRPQESFYELLQQRQRWLDGALRIPVYLILPLLINGLFLFLLIPLLLWNWKIGLIVWGLRFIFHATSIIYFASKVKKTEILKFLPLYEVFITFFNPLVFVFYILPTKMRWKQREF